MESIRIVVPDDVARKLRELAERDYRAPRSQAAVLLIAAVERAAARKPAAPRGRP